MVDVVARILPPRTQALAAEVAFLARADPDAELMPLYTYFKTVVPGLNEDEDPPPEALAAARPDPAALAILEAELRASRDRLLARRPLPRRLVFRLARPLIRPALAIARRFFLDRTTPQPPP